MDYNEMLFALLIRQEAMKRITDEERAGVAATDDMQARLKEVIRQLVGATRGVAVVIRELDDQ